MACLKWLDVDFLLNREWKVQSRERRVQSRKRPLLV
jgi:hypothetical protein